MKRVLILVILISISFISANQEECSKIFFWILNNNYNYTDSDINSLNISNASYLIEHYNEECYLKNYSDVLPVKELKDYPKLIIDKRIKCDLNVIDVLEVSIPFFKISLDNCPKNLKYFFKVEEPHAITGLRLFQTIILISLIVFIIIFIKNKRLNEKIEKIT